MKIKVFHDLCGREVLVRQILDSRGHCPWDGKAFTRDYTAIMAHALEAAENGGSLLENALEKIASMEADLTIERDSVLGPLVEHLDALDRRPGGG